MHYCGGHTDVHSLPPIACGTGKTTGTVKVRKLMGQEKDSLVSEGAGRRDTKVTTDITP